MLQSPLPGFVRERQVAIVPKHVVGLGVAWQVGEKAAHPWLVTLLDRCVQRANVIQIIDSLGITVADKNVLAPVVVEVGEQSAPAPISVRDASQSSDLTENDVTIFGKAVAQLKRVLRVVDAIAVAGCRACRHRS